MNRRSLAAGALALLTAALLAPAASADQVYHSEHLALSPVGGAPLKSGFVENIHPNGPQVYAHETPFERVDSSSTSAIPAVTRSTATNFGSTELKDERGGQRNFRPLHPERAERDP